MADKKPIGHSVRAGNGRDVHMVRAGGGGKGTVKDATPGTGVTLTGTRVRGVVVKSTEVSETLLKHFFLVLLLVPVTLQTWMNPLYLSYVSIWY